MGKFSMFRTGPVETAAALQLQVLAPAWFGLTPQPFTPSHALTLGGPFALAGWLLALISDMPGSNLYGLMILFLCRLVLRRALLISCAYVAVWTVVDSLFSESHGIIRPNNVPPGMVMIWTSSHPTKAKGPSSVNACDGMNGCGVNPNQAGAST